MKPEIITSKQNAALVHARKLLRSRAYRQQCQEYIAEGTKLLEEALKWKAGVKMILLSEALVCPGVPDEIRVLQIPEDLMRQLSLQEQPQGAMFVCSLPAPRMQMPQGGSIILDGIQDPGNLGTILRTADALEVPVILTEGCCDAYSPKTIRASMGAVFRTPPGRACKRDIMEACRAAQVELMATAMTEGAADIRTVALNKAAVIIGSEGQGISEELLQAAQKRIVIPMQARCESLNAAVAAAIVMWQMKQ